jgi:hypothetical protein
MGATAQRVSQSSGEPDERSASGVFADRLDDISGSSDGCDWSIRTEVPPQRWETGGAGDQRQKHAVTVRGRVKRHSRESPQATTACGRGPGLRCGKQALPPRHA